jgi:hypothetical protein
VKPPVPGLTLHLADPGRNGALIGQVVGNARERIHGGDVRPHWPREQPRGDGKILVVRLCQPLARGVRA